MPELGWVDEIGGASEAYSCEGWRTSKKGKGRGKKTLEHDEVSQQDVSFGCSTGGPFPTEVLGTCMNMHVLQIVPPKLICRPSAHHDYIANRFYFV